MNQNQRSETKWYLKWWTVFVWLALLGPFALPFLWKSKDFNLFWKWFLTIAILVLTVVLTWSTFKLVKILIDELKQSGLMR